MATSQADRAQGAILGSLVADTATMGLHWIYDMDKFAALLKESGKAAAPEFFEPPSCPYYQASMLLQHSSAAQLTHATSQQACPTQCAPSVSPAAPHHLHALRGHLPPVSMH